MKRFSTTSAILAMAVTGALALSMPSIGQTNDGTKTTEKSREVLPGGTVRDTTKSETIVRDNVNVQDANRTLADATVATDVRSRLTDIVNKGMEQNGFNDLVGSLSKAQRERLNDEKFKELDKLNASIERFRKTFKEQYKEDFAFKAAYLSDVPVYRGANNDEATVLLASMAADLKSHVQTFPDPSPTDKAHNNNTKRMDPSSDAKVNSRGDVVGVKEIDQATGKPRLDAAGKPIDTPAVTKDAAGNTRVDNSGSTKDGIKTDGTNADATPRTTVDRGAASDALTDTERKARMAMMTDLHLVKETMLGNAWRLQVAAPPSARQLANALSNEIDKLNTRKDWPADAKKGHLMVAKHILGAIENASTMEADRKEASLSPF